MSTKKFEYIICLDFEATCWEVRDVDQAEVIEFGAVLLNLQNGVIESEFHEYVRPTHHPILSNYCINLTGITQNHINQQQPFPIIFGRFVSWLDEIRRQKGVRLTTVNQRNVNNGCNTTFCTWTDWDLRNFFQNDCKRNGIKRPESTKAWIDARKLFEKIYHERKPFAVALLTMGIVPIGKAHSAIVDARNLATMVMRLYRLGADFAQVTNWQFV